MLSSQIVQYMIKQTGIWLNFVEFGGGTLMAAACNVVWLCWSASRRAPCAPFDYYDFSNKLLN
ncbi:hypothetical protein HanHA300_Chr12g0458831 [Helianthus annuus]|nr:hypothetical protein HanHA300_Chr12g0458831 [Helianthus annuus]KAJ0506642.1 hypothetical protein HanHA89_Chr12g0484441 [Helianthus annuus]KAJ0676317.1 hypothetical protein HanLR1_Chr12g0461421 [Helianthus annuus]